MTIPHQISRSKVLLTAPTVITRERRGVQYNWPNGNRKYVCYNDDIDADEADTDWEIIKYTEDNLKFEGPQQGAVNTEAVINALSWNI